MRSLIHKETSGSGHCPRATQVKLHVPSNALEAEQLMMLAHGTDDSERSVPDWFSVDKRRHKWQSYAAYKDSKHIWDDNDA